MIILTALAIMVAIVAVSIAVKLIWLIRIVAIIGIICLIIENKDDIICQIDNPIIAIAKLIGSIFVIICIMAIIEPVVSIFV